MCKAITLVIEYDQELPDPDDVVGCHLAAELLYDGVSRVSGWPSRSEDLELVGAGHGHTAERV